MDEGERVKTNQPPPAPAGRRMIFSWALWDWGSAAFQAVITTFVFGPYLVRGVVGEGERVAGLTANTWLGISSAAAGLVIALIAPITGQRADAAGRRKRSLALWSATVMLVMVAMFWVRNDPSYLWLGLALLAAGSIFQEFALVSYNAMLHQVSTPRNVGRVSGFGWMMGYFGGIFLLLICFVGFLQPGGGLFGVTTEGALNVRSVTLLSALWFAVFAIPVLVAVPETPPGPARRRIGFFRSYPLLVRDIKQLWSGDRNAVYFLIASALYRDGLVAVFSFGAILAVSVYGLDQSEVLIFGIVASLVAGAGSFIFGRLEDRIGPKRVIMISLIGLISTALILLVFVHSSQLFWVFGLLLTLWVGPAQGSSRSFLARIAPEGREGEMFGLYATTGRAASFLAPGLFAVFSGIFNDRVGIVGIALVLLAGALALAKVKSPAVPGIQIARDLEHIGE